MKLNPSDIDQNGYTPLLNSVYFGHLDLVKYLIEKIKVDSN